MDRFACIMSVQRHNKKIDRVWFQWASAEQTKGTLHSLAIPIGSNSEEAMKAHEYTLVSSLEELEKCAQEANACAELASQRERQAAEDRIANIDPALEKYLLLKYYQEMLFDGVSFKCKTDILEHPIFYITKSDRYLCAKCATQVCREDEIVLPIILERDHTSGALVCDFCNPYLAETLVKIMIEGRRLREGMILYAKSDDRKCIVIEISDDGRIMMDTGHFGYGRSHRETQEHDTSYRIGLRGYTLVKPNSAK